MSANQEIQSPVWGNEPHSRREIFGACAAMAAVAAFSILGIKKELERDLTASVDDIVNSPELIPHRQVVCTGFVKGAGEAQVTTIIGGYPIKL
jgi:hypothetical protein